MRLPSLVIMKGRSRDLLILYLGFCLNDLFFISGRPTLSSEVGIIICDITNQPHLMKWLSRQQLSSTV